MVPGSKTPTINQLTVGWLLELRLGLGLIDRVGDEVQVTGEYLDNAGGVCRLIWKSLLLSTTSLSIFPTRLLSSLYAFNLIFTWTCLNKGHNLKQKNWQNWRPFQAFWLVCCIYSLLLVEIDIIWALKYWSWSSDTVFDVGQELYESE